MCKFCEEYGEFLFKNFLNCRDLGKYGIYLYIYKTALRFQLGGKIPFSKTINFCPICGRELKDDAND